GDALRRGTARDPRFDRAHLVERVGADAALAVVHARHHEQRDAVRRLLLADARDDVLVVDRAGLRRHLLVGPAVIHEQLAAVREEWPEARIARRDPAAAGLGRLLDALPPFEGPPVQARILEQDDREARRREAERLRAADVSPTELGSGPEMAVIDLLASADVG